MRNAFIGAFIGAAAGVAVLLLVGTGSNERQVSDALKDVKRGAPGARAATQREPQPMSDAEVRRELRLFRSHLSQPDPTSPRTARACGADGASTGMVLVHAERGEVDCDAAYALWREYERRAPSEGMGSGGYLKLRDWGCISGETNRPSVDLGSCERLDHSALFNVKQLGE